MICPDCGREHRNSKGKCPFCSTRPPLVQRQSERPSPTTGGGEKFACEDCGQEIKEWEDNLMGYGQVPVHVCPSKK
jgi:hypothetical protein